MKAYVGCVSQRTDFSTLELYYNLQSQNGITKSGTACAIFMGWNIISQTVSDLFNLELIGRWYLFYAKETSIATQPVSQFVGGDCYRTDYPIQKAFRRNSFFMPILFNGALKTAPYGFFENSKHKTDTIGVINFYTEA